jgi:hypothetical protein
VDPPIAINITKAFRKDAGVRIFDGVMFLSMQTRIALVALMHSWSLFAWVAGVQDELGRLRPIATH